MNTIKIMICSKWYLDNTLYLYFLNFLPTYLFTTSHLFYIHILYSLFIMFSYLNIYNPDFFVLHKYDVLVTELE